MRAGPALWGWHLLLPPQDQHVYAGKLPVSLLSAFCTHPHLPSSSSGLSLDGTPLAPLKSSGVLVPSSDPECIVPDGSKLLVTPTSLSGKLGGNMSRT
jgi:hypothetical protein